MLVLNSNVNFRQLLVAANRSVRNPKIGEVTYVVRNRYSLLMKWRAEFKFSSDGKTSCPIVILIYDQQEKNRRHVGSYGVLVMPDESVVVRETVVGTETNPFIQVKGAEWETDWEKFKIQLPDIAEKIEQFLVTVTLNSCNWCSLQIDKEAAGIK